MKENRVNLTKDDNNNMGGKVMKRGLGLILGLILGWLLIGVINNTCKAEYQGTGIPEEEYYDVLCNDFIIRDVVDIYDASRDSIYRIYTYSISSDEEGFDSWSDNPYIEECRVCLTEFDIYTYEITNYKLTYKVTKNGLTLVNSVCEESEIYSETEFNGRLTSLALNSYRDLYTMYGDVSDKIKISYTVNIKNED